MILLSPDLIWLNTSHLLSLKLTSVVTIYFIDPQRLSIENLEQHSSIINKLTELKPLRCQHVPSLPHLSLFICSHDSRAKTQGPPLASLLLKVPSWQPHSGQHWLPSWEFFLCMLCRLFLMSDDLTGPELYLNFLFLIFLSLVLIHYYIWHH